MTALPLAQPGMPLSPQSWRLEAASAFCWPRVVSPGEQLLSMLFVVQPMRRTEEVSPGSMGHKAREFRLWALEVHHTHVEELDDTGRLHLFGQYMDAYNARQLPQQKHYDLDAWEKEERVGSGCR